LSRIALLDVNLLVALFDGDHVHHEIAHDWFADHRAGGWATCSITETGIVRVLAATRGGAALMRPAELVERLQHFCSSGHHIFWPHSVSLRDENVFRPSFVRGHSQITDIYLLGLAVRMGGCLATFDRTIPLGAVVGASRDALHVISAAASGESAPS
jgi:toxin-antitoxin system PIN domain toxin